MPNRSLLVLFSLISLGIISCRKKGEDSICLIPNNYEGNVLIIFNQHDGLDTSWEGKARIYRIDTTGILKTKFEAKYGVQRTHYYYVDSAGARTEVKVAFPSHSQESDQVVVVNPEYGNHFDTVLKIQQHFKLFTIARQNQMDSIGNLRSKFMWDNLK
jgi:hypothetical protein